MVTDAGFPAALAGWTRDHHRTLVDGKPVRTGLEEGEGFYFFELWTSWLRGTISKVSAMNLGVWWAATA